MFEVELEDLESEHVQAFLDGVSGEGLIWEAKGTASLRELKPKIVAGVGGLANQLGDYFVVGATEGERNLDLRRSRGRLRGGSA